MTSAFSNENTETLRAAYRAHSNTFGYVGHVLERRPSGDKSDAAWEPIYEYGTREFGIAELWRFGEWVTVPSKRTRSINYYDEAKTGAAMLKELQAYTTGGFTYRMARYPLSQRIAEEMEASNTWKAREALKMTDGTYTPLPWADEPWFKDEQITRHHYAHVSLEDAGKVAFTRDDAQGRRNVRTRMSAGRYLNEFFQYALACQPRKETGGVNVHGQKVTVDALNWHARTFTTQYGGADQLLFATTGEDMVEVYTNGPQSCMSYAACDLASDPHHPAQVYAAGDLHLAYIKSVEGNITARALVWPAKMLLGRIYGDEVSLQAALSELGYPRQDNYCLNGAKIKRIPFGEGFLMPYIDGSRTFGRITGDTEHFKIGGSESGEFTNGLSYDPDENQCECDRCSARMDEDETYSVLVSRRDTASWCMDCYENETFVCDYSSNTYSLSDVHYTELADGNLVADYYLSHYGECALTGDWYSNNDLSPYMDGDDLVCEAAIEDNDLVADEDGHYWKADELPQPAADPVSQIGQEAA